MDETILTWTVPNWITVILMVLLGFAAISVVGKVIVKAKANSDA